MEYTQWEVHTTMQLANNVLILVVMEYTQWDKIILLPPSMSTVLILVVMEYTQWEQNKKILKEYSKVLILVVMEYTQWVFVDSKGKLRASLNPCCNGIYSMSDEESNNQGGLTCLNPCCNGIYSMRYSGGKFIIFYKVLILVVMEYTQWVVCYVSFRKNLLRVLILVVMEYTQWVLSTNNP